jgi:hypothetical protein
MMSILRSYGLRVTVYGEPKSPWIWKPVVLVWTLRLVVLGLLAIQALAVFNSHYLEFKMMQFALFLATALILGRILLPLTVVYLPEKDTP